MAAEKPNSPRVTLTALKKRLNEMRSSESGGSYNDLRKLKNDVEMLSNKDALDVKDFLQQVDRHITKKDTLRVNKLVETQININDATMARFSQLKEGGFDLGKAKNLLKDCDAKSSFTEKIFIDEKLSDEQKKGLLTSLTNMTTMKGNLATLIDVNQSKQGLKRASKSAEGESAANIIDSIVDQKQANRSRSGSVPPGARAVVEQAESRRPRSESEPTPKAEAKDDDTPRRGPGA